MTITSWVSRSSPTQGYRGDIDGLRAFAVLSVVAFHGGLAGVPGGFIGVDIFFVISGYLLGGIVHREIEAGEFTFRHFYVRRARRILPALIATGVMTLGLGSILLGPGEYRRLAAGIGAALLGVSNLWFMHTTDYFNQDARLEPFLMTWSHGIEEQFYILLPIMMLVVRRTRGHILRWTLVAVLASLALGVAATAIRPVEAFYLLPTRAWELGIGVALAMIQAQGWNVPTRHQRWLTWTGLATLAGGVVLLDESSRFPGYAALVPTLGTAVLIATPAGGANRLLLASRPAIAIGRLSYSWYLLHWPALAFCGSVPLRLRRSGWRLRSDWPPSCRPTRCGDGSSARSAAQAMIGRMGRSSHAMRRPSSGASACRSLSWRPGACRPVSARPASASMRC